MSIKIYESIELAIEGNIAKLTLRRPGSYNAMNQQLVEELNSALERIEELDVIRGVILTGEGAAFCAGADLKQDEPSFAQDSRDALGTSIEKSMIEGFNPIIAKIYHSSKPYIAAVNGPVAGGGVGLALACDIVIAAESAYFMQVFIPQLGIIPDLGSTWFLPRLIGNAKARAAMLLGDSIDSKTAEQWGMIYRCVPDGDLLRLAQELVDRLARGPSFGISNLKKVLAATELNSLDQQLAKEAEVQRACTSSTDFIEGIRAFNEKRKPNFTGVKDADADEYQ